MMGLNAKATMPLAAAAVLGFAASAELPAQVATWEPEPARQFPFDLTIREIMRGSELVGLAPEDVRWTDDGAWLYFTWLPGGSDWQADRELYRVRVPGGEPEPVPEGERDSVDVLLAGGDVSPDGAFRVVENDGDLYLVDRAAQTSRRLTDTREAERSPRFTVDGQGVLYRSGDDLFELSLEGGEIRQLTDIRSGPAPRDDEEPEGHRRFLEEQQLELFEHVRRQAALEDSAEAREDRAGEHPEPVHLAAIERVATLEPSRDGGHVLLVVRTPAEEARDTSVPEWITRSGYTTDRTARSKVGDAADASRVGLLRTETGELTWLDPRPDGFEEEVRVSARGWNDAGTHGLVVARSDDDEHRFLYAVEAATGQLTLLDALHDEAWVGGPCGFGCVGWLPGTRTAWFVSEATGYAHLYLVEADGRNRRALTSGSWEVRAVELPEANGTRDRFLLRTSEASPFDERLAWLDVRGGALEYPIEGRGHYEGFPSPAGSRMAVIRGTANRPPELFILDADGTGQAALTRITESPTEDWRSFPWIEPEIVSVRADDGVAVPARIYRPADLDAEPNGAGVIFVHGAGYLQNVHNGWSSYFREYMFHHFLAAAGYTVLDIDYRGSAGYGRDWRTAIHRHMGGRDLADQVDGARYLVEHEGVDPERVGIYGGSYGGFITLMALFTAGDTFRAGAALRSVTDWAHYNDGYTSNILNDPDEDPDAYRRSSPIYFAENLRPDQHLLILHGMVDTNVQFSDVVRLAQRLIELGKENWELAVYPAEGHAFEAPSAWTDEYRRIFELFERTIGEPRT